VLHPSLWTNSLPRVCAKHGGTSDEISSLLIGPESGVVLLATRRVLEAQPWKPFPLVELRQEQSMAVKGLSASCLIPLV
jgi:hypothetical protein